MYKRLHLTAPKEGDETIGGLTDEETTETAAVVETRMSPMTWATEIRKP